MSADHARLVVKVELVSWHTDPVLRWICDPAVEFGFLPSRAIDAQLDLWREGAFFDFPIDGRPGQAGAVEDGLEADDAVWFGHSRCSIG
jgi:hypothetical protein